MKIKLDDLIVDSYIYPREKKSQKTITSYAEALSIGAEFPPIEVQQVIGYPGKEVGEVVSIIIDGVHRSGACAEYNKENGSKILDIEAIEYLPDEVLDYEEHKIELRLESAERNTRHGTRIGEGDKKATARLIATDDPEKKWTDEIVASKLGVPRKSINNWTKDIRARQRAGRDSKIIRLSRLGWTQQEIADVVGISRPRVSGIVSFGQLAKTDNGSQPELQLEESTQSDSIPTPEGVRGLIDQSRDMAYIADYYRMDLALAWSLRLDGEKDLERFGNGGAKEKEDRYNLEWPLHPYGDWRFHECDKRFGDDWPGRIPAQLVAHALYFFTRQGDWVMDPMAGGGVVPDTCLALNRKCRAFDLNIRQERPEIQKYHWNLENLQWPEMKELPDLIFFDPPYYKKKESEYEDKADEGQVPISSLSRDQFLAFFRGFFDLAYKNSKESTRLAFLIAEWRDFESTPALEEKQGEALFLYDYYKLLEETNWIVTHNIQCPMSNARLSSGVMAAMQKSRILGTVERTLIMARKKGGFLDD